MKVSNLRLNRVGEAVSKVMLRHLSMSNQVNIPDFIWFFFFIIAYIFFFTVPKSINKSICYLETYYQIRTKSDTGNLVEYIKRWFKKIEGTRKLTSKLRE